MDNRITDEIRALCGVSNYSKYNDFGGYEIMRGRVADACDKIDQAFEEQEDSKLDADCEFENLKTVCECIIGNCDGLTGEEMANQSVGKLAALEKRLMPDGYEWLLEVWPKWSNGEYCKFGDWWTAERYGEYKPKQFRRLVIYTPEQLSEWGQGDGESYGYEWDFMRPSEVGYRPDKADPPSPQVLAADGEPLEVGQTVWDVESGTEYEVVGIWIDEDSPIRVMRVDGSHLAKAAKTKTLTHQLPVLDADGVPIKVGDTVYVIDTGSSAEVLKVDGHGCYLNFGSLCETYDADKLTHTKPEPPDSWELLEMEAASYGAAAYCDKHPDAKEIQTDLTMWDRKAIHLVRRCKALAGVE